MKIIRGENKFTAQVVGGCLAVAGGSVIRVVEVFVLVRVGVGLRVVYVAHPPGVRGAGNWDRECHGSSAGYREIFL